MVCAENRFCLRHRLGSRSGSQLKPHTEGAFTDLGQAKCSCCWVWLDTLGGETGQIHVRMASVELQVYIYIFVSAWSSVGAEVMGRNMKLPRTRLACFIPN